jgi:succinate dehydrogenase / fumarate reductase, iron-sulfur subunit
MEERSVRQLLGEEIRTITLAVKRYRPESGDFTESRYEVQADRFTTLLDMLISVKERQDSSLSMRHSCNMGICGSCGMVINGKPRLACETNAFSLKTKSITVGPMEAHPLVRDLVTDLHELFDKHEGVTPWLVRRDLDEKYRAEKEYSQTERQVDFYIDFAHCISCGLCVDACPVSNTNTEFIGPQALSQAHRYNSDSRDEGEKLRLDRLDSMEGVWGCEFAGACSAVCPKGVDPALAIQLTKLALMRYRLTGKTNLDKRAK